MRQLLIFILSFLASVCSYAAESTGTFSSIEITPDIYVMSGGGSNSVISIGTDGVLMVDNELPENFPMLKNKIASLTDAPIKLVFNTHWHPDHIGGNTELNASGALSIAHVNLKRRLQHENYIPLIDSTFPPFAPEALPLVTFSDGMTLQFNDNEIEVISFPGAHTDGDSIVFFRQANVIHAGGIFYNYRYPYVDADAGGTLRGTIEATRYIISLMDKNTIIVPGHGEIGKREDLIDTLNMLEETSATMRQLISEEMALEDIIASKPNAKWDSVYGQNTLSADDYTEWLYLWITTEG